MPTVTLIVKAAPRAVDAGKQLHHPHLRGPRNGYDRPLRGREFRTADVLSGSQADLVSAEQSLDGLGPLPTTCSRQLSLWNVS